MPKKLPIVVMTEWENAAVFFFFLNERMLGAMGKL